MASRRKHQDIDASAVPLPAEAAFEEGGLFVFDARPIVRNWPAKVRLPLPDGKIRVHEIRFDLQYMTMDDLNATIVQEAEFKASAASFGSKTDPLFDKVHGWSGIASQGKGALAYSDANKARLLQDERIRRAINEALGRMVLGIEEKNSETPPDAGQPRSAAPNRAQRRAAGKRVQEVLKGPAKATA